jgi:glutathione peroxidase
VSLIPIVLVTVRLVLAGTAGPTAPAVPAPHPLKDPKVKERAMSFYDLTETSIDLQPAPLSRWRGKVSLVVNTASECGNTPQYAGLEKLWQSYKDRDFALLGFPSNDFGRQEPGSEAEIKKFCSLKYHVTFPMFAKVKTRGEGKSPAYQFLTANHGEPRWNFHKYLVGKDGQVIRAFSADVQPEDPELRAAIDAALK